jgi:ATPase subunit of ABC transporter with duplicated ATPase domains
MVGVSKFYDKKPVLKDIYLSYFYGAKIGVIGLNGSGKSSLLRILAGVDKDFNGETVISPGFTVGYLEQEPLLDDDRTVREVVEEAVKETVELLKEFEEINAKFGEEMSDDEMNALLERQGTVQEKLDHLDAWDLDSRLEMRSVVRRRTLRSKFFPGASVVVSHFADCCCRNPTSCCSTNQRIIWMLNRSRGWNITCKTTRERSSP